MAFTGKIKWFEPAKRYGFIIPDGGGGDVFLMEEDRPFNTGDKVKFDLERTESGNVKAINVEYMDDLDNFMQWGTLKP